MTKVITAYNNFARGKIDHDMMGRFDLPVYRSAADVFENFVSNFKGNAIYRTGLMDTVGAFQDCVLQEFKFSNDQNYLLLFYNTKIRFLSYDSNGNFGYVESAPSVPLEVTTPYSLDECRDLRFTQNHDVMVMTHPDYQPRDLTRTSATTFTVTSHTTTGASFSSPNFPSSCLFYKGRLYLANTNVKTTTVWASEVGFFNNYTIPGTATDASPLEFTIADVSQPIEWLFGGDNSLIAGTADGLVAINGGGASVAITASTIEADLTSGDGCNRTIPIKKDGLVFYVGKNNRNIYYFNYSLLTESFTSQDSNFISYDITKTGIGKIRHKKDRNDLIHGVRGDGGYVTLNFQEKENIIGWHDHSTEGCVKDIAVITDNDGNPQYFALVLRDGAYYVERQADHVEFSERVDFFTEDEKADDEAYNRMVSEEFLQVNHLDNSLFFDNLQEGNAITFDSIAETITAANPIFVSGDVGKHISYKTETGYESGRFEITNFISTTVVDVEVLQEPTQNTYDNWYLSFNELSGLTQYIGNTIGVVTDGGYLADFEIDSDTLELGSEVLSVTLGYKYKGIIKSFSLGFQNGAENTQTTMKAITRVGIRSVASAGGKFGSSLYRLEPVQALSQNDINYLPPLPMDGTKYISLVDSNEKDKFFYIVQDIPLPLVIATAMIDANYSVTR